MSLKKIKGLLKPAYLKAYDILNNIFFKNYILSNAKLFKENNKFCSLLEGEKVLIFAPHIDDDMIGCGGAIMKYLSMGKDVSICYLTDSGKLGSKGSRAEITKERREEALCAAASIGLSKEKLFFFKR